MASAFSHIVVPAVIYAGFKSPAMNGRLLLVAAILSVLPDLDVIAFRFGIPYASPWGHRGFTHSISFSILIAVVIATFYRRLHSTPLIVFTTCFIATLSHALLDMLTNGGLGVALFWPLNNERVFFPWRPIQVSPIGVGAFFSERGMAVIRSELLWVGLPGILLAMLGIGLRKSRRQSA